VQWPQKVPGNATTDFVTLKADVIERRQALAWFHRSVRTNPKGRVLVFIHGFNNRFDDAVFRFAQIVHDSQAPVVPILFTWPSKGSVLAYGYDRESTAYSRNALEALLKAISRDRAVGEISILAHSMGNSLALETLRQMAIRDGRVAPKIRNVLLTAPDVDVDLAREAIVDLGPRANRPSFTLSYHRTTGPSPYHVGSGAARLASARSIQIRSPTGRSSSRRTSRLSTLPS
jgi:esterase/lipase superfamily enzyme